MISIAALHQARRSLNGRVIKLEHSPTPENDAGIMISTHTSTIGEDPCAVYDSLRHKQHALQQIQQELLSSNFRHIEGTIASILLLIWQDCMDSGKNSWRYHLDALKQIAELQKSSTQFQQARCFLFDFASFERYLEMTYAT
jgi:hypothetical protein